MNQSLDLDCKNAEPLDEALRRLRLKPADRDAQANEC
jgi:hypothetical protein